jgi:hypothetical protein
MENTCINEDMEFMKISYKNGKKQVQHNDVSQQMRDLYYDTKQTIINVEKSIKKIEEGIENNNNNNKKIDKITKEFNKIKNETEMMLSKKVVIKNIYEENNKNYIHNEDNKTKKNKKNKKNTHSQRKYILLSLIVTVFVAIMSYIIFV